MCARGQPVALAWRDGRQSAFTLVELLIVIAILALLTGLAVPAVIGVRHQVNTNICSHNLRGAGTALVFYADQHKRFPPTKDAVKIGGVYYRRSAHDFLSTYMGHDSQLMGMPLHEPSSIARYRPDNFTCPAESRDEDGYHFRIAPGICHNPGPMTDTAGGHHSILSRGYTADSLLAFMADGTPEDAYMLSLGDGMVHGLNVQRHASGSRTHLTLGANYLFADGHVEFSSRFHEAAMDEAPWKIPGFTPNP